MTHTDSGPLSRDDVYIGGAWQPSTGTGRIEVVDPTTESVIGSVPSGTAEDVDAAVKAARTAFETWSLSSTQERSAWLERIAEALTARADEFAGLIARELGMPLAQSRGTQVGMAISDFRTTAAAIPEITWEEEIGTSLVLREPVGVIGAITPWNFPLHQITAKFAAALAAGCTVVVKPSETTPLSAYMFADVLDRIGLPPGVFNLVCGVGPVVGEAVVTHPGVDMVSFTGSAQAGRRISELAAARLKPVAMELGGKSAAIVLDDADLRQAINGVLVKTYQNSGQACTAPTRLLVDRARMPEAERIAAEISTAVYRPGDPFEEKSTQGPVVSAAQRDRVRAYIRRGVEEGAKLVCGGAGPPSGLDTGYFVAPTVFSDVRSGMTIAQEEIFGPVLAILPFDDEEEAIAIANDSDYGLAGQVWSADRERAIRVARRVRTGMVSINGGAFNPRAPFGGMKQSGHGRELGRFGIEEFLTYKSLQL